MSGSQGRRLSKQTIARIQRLLAETDLTVNEIAESVAYSRAAVLSVNRRFGIRSYIGRTQWLVNEVWQLKAGEKAG